MNSEDYKIWWRKAEIQLEKLGNEVLKTVHEDLFKSLVIEGIPVPELEIIGDETFFNWESFETIVVSHDDNYDCDLYIPGLGSFELPLSVKDSDIIFEFFPNLVKKPSPTNPVIEDNDDEVFLTRPQIQLPPTTPPSPPPKKDQPDMMKMMGSMMKSLETMLKDDFDEIDNEPPKETIQLDNIGKLLSMIFVTFLGFMRWFITKLSSRIPMKSAMKGVILDMIEEVNCGVWDDFFDIPDDWLRTRSSKLHSMINFMFGILRFIVEHKNVIIPLVTLGIGYKFGSL
jgi:hypothetical protein